MRFLVVGSCILTSFSLYLIHKLRSSALFFSAQPVYSHGHFSLFCFGECSITGSGCNVVMFCHDLYRIHWCCLRVSGPTWHGSCVQLLASRIWGLCFSLLCVCLLYWRNLFSTWLFLLFFSSLLLTMPDLFLSISLELVSVNLPPFFDNMHALLAVRYLVIFLVNLTLITATFICYIVIYPLEKMRYAFHSTASDTIAVSKSTIHFPIWFGLFLVNKI